MEHVRKNPDKSFFVIGVASILDKMVVWYDKNYAIFLFIFLKSEFLIW
jgi:hypothetical protein